MAKYLRDLVGQLPEAVATGSLDIEITGIAHDSREVKPGMLFVCISGEKADGHMYARQAVQNGAVAVLAQREMSFSEPVSVIQVEDTRNAALKIAPYFYEYPARRMRLIGITGTNGKTTTSYLIRSILREAGYKVGVIGTIQILIEDEALPVHNTTPDVIDLQAVLFQMAQRKMDFVIMEVSSHALALKRVAGCEFDTAVFTNMTQDHLDFHKSFENYLAAKAKLFDLLTAADCVKQGKTAVVNADDAAAETILAHAKCPAFTYGMKSDASLRAEKVEVLAGGACFTASGAFGKLDLMLKITGIFNVYNVMAAIGAALAQGVAPEVIKRALEAFTSVPGRFELVDEGQDFSVIVDYAHTPDGLENILKTARQITDRRIITVFGCGGDRDQTKRPIMGRIAAQLSDVIIATSDNPRTEDPEFILSQVEEGVLSALCEEKVHEKITDRREAIERAIEIARSGDIVMIAGKGHEDYQILKDRTIHFDDKEVAREALRRLK